MGIACCSHVEKQEEPRKDYIQEALSERLTQSGSHTITTEKEVKNESNEGNQRRKTLKREIQVGNKLQITYKLESMSYWKSNKQSLIEEIISTYKKLQKDFLLSHLLPVDDILENSHQDERLLKQVYYKLYTLNAYLTKLSTAEKDDLSVFRRIKTVDEMEVMMESQIDQKNESLLKYFKSGKDQFGIDYDEVSSLNEKYFEWEEGRKRLFLWEVCLNLKEIDEKRRREVDEERCFVEKRRVLKRVMKEEEERKVRKEMLLMKAVIPHKNKRNLKEEEEDDEESEGNNGKIGNFGSMF